MRVPLTRYGLREISLAAVVASTAGAALWAWWPPLAVLALAGFGYVLAFFRDPYRVPEETPLPDGALLAPADGTIDFIGESYEPLLGGRCLRISIFLSVFDVHLNRAPLAGRIERKEYRRGEYLDARREDSAGRNESNTLLIAADQPPEPELRVVVRQISGAIARRIVCPPAEGQRVAIGERIGMIKFGSRTDLCVPLERGVELKARLGQHVRAGHSLLGVAR